MEAKHVLFGTQTYGPHSIGFIELSRPDALNALNEEMLKAIALRLFKWTLDPSIACVVIHSENPKAFCAGGDVKSLATSRLMGEGIDSAKNFFSQEYFTDHYVHKFPKPILAWLDGICMGGGVGLTQGASHKVVTERTVMAMPEVFIGFFADVGATRFLADLRSDVGLYLGMTGKRFSGSTGVSIGLVNYLLPSVSKRQVFADLVRLPWTGEAAIDRELLTTYLIEKSQLPSNELTEWKQLENIFKRGDFAEIAKALAQDVYANVPANAAPRRPSLLSQAVFYRLGRKHKGADWRDVFAQEWATALHFCADTSGGAGVGEFAEGVRALLIDKEPAAKWPERSIADAWAESEKFVQPVEPNGFLARQM